MKISKTDFGKTEDGSDVKLYTLSNSQGIEISFINYGANIVDIITPDKHGNKKDINLGFNNIKDYEVNGPGLGSFIGRNANRIADAEVEIDGKKYSLEKNDGNNCLHSGSRSYNKYIYEVNVFEEKDAACIEFSRLSLDMEQGFPGNLDVTVTYTLTEENELVIEYFAVSDKETVVNFTNHAYFNLAGHDSGDVLKQKVRILADEFTKTDSKLIPTGEFVRVAGTPMDFRDMKAVGKDIHADYEPLKIAGGYDHNYVLNDYNGEIRKAAELYDEESGRFMEVYTDLPGMQLYTANSLSCVGKGGCQYKAKSGICFETQFYPNSCNMEGVPNGRIKAGEEFESTTKYKFSLKE